MRLLNQQTTIDFGDFRLRSTDFSSDSSTPSSLASTLRTNRFRNTRPDRLLGQFEGRRGFSSLRPSDFGSTFDLSSGIYQGKARSMFERFMTQYSPLSLPSFGGNNRGTTLRRLASNRGFNTPEFGAMGSVDSKNNNPTAQNGGNTVSGSGSANSDHAHSDGSNASGATGGGHSHGGPIASGLGGGGTLYANPVGNAVSGTSHSGHVHGPDDPPHSDSPDETEEADHTHPPGYVHSDEGEDAASDVSLGEENTEEEADYQKAKEAAWAIVKSDVESKGGNMEDWESEVFINQYYSIDGTRKEEVPEL